MENRICFAQGIAHRTPNGFVGRSTLGAICARRPAATAIGQRRRPRVSMGLFGLGFPELAVIAGVGIFIFGPSKVAEMGKDLGGFAGGVKKATAEFREAMEESLEEADREIEKKKIEKESASSKTVDATATAVEESGNKD